MLEKQLVSDGCKLDCIAGRAGVELDFLFFVNVLCVKNAFHVLNHHILA